MRRSTFQLQKGFFSEKRGGNSVNEGFGKDFYRKGTSVKRSGPFSEPPDSEKKKTEKLLSPSLPENQLLKLQLREEKAYTTTTERKSFGELFWPQRETFQAGGGYKNPIKPRKTISTTEIFPLWTPFFLQRKVLHWSRAVYGFFFPATVKQRILG